MKSYIELINRFWNADTHTGVLNQYDTRLYFFLLNSCNEHYWKMPIGHSDRYLADRLGMSVNTLRNSKSRLAEMNLITYMVPQKASKGVAGQCRYSFPTVSPHDTVGGKNKRPTVSPSDTVNNTTVSPDDTVIEITETEPYHPVTQTVSSSDTVEAPTVSPSDTNNKTILRQEDTTTIPNGIVGQEPETKNPKKRKKSSSAGAENISEATPHWQVLVEVWFEFNKTNFGASPSFKGADPRELKSIVTNLQKRSIAKGHEWTEEQATATFQVFLKCMYEDKWLKNNFLLQNLNRQFDKIINSYGKGNSKGGPMGSGLAIIDQMHDN